MAIHTTIATNGLEHEVNWSAFPSMFWNLNGWRCGWNCLRGMEFVIDVEEYMESWKDRICLECRGGHILSEESVDRGVLWQAKGCEHSFKYFSTAIVLFSGHSENILWPNCDISTAKIHNLKYIVNRPKTDQLWASYETQWATTWFKFWKKSILYIYLYPSII